jgi:mercuric ion transport protein
MNQDIQPPPNRLGGLFAGGGLLTGFAALVGASCCVLPILLVQIGVSAALVAQLAIFAQAKPYLLAATGMLIAGGFVAAYWAGGRPRTRVLVLLIAAATLVVAAYVMPHVEGDILRWMRPR